MPFELERWNWRNQTQSQSRILQSSQVPSISKKKEHRIAMARYQNVTTQKPTVCSPGPSNMSKPQIPYQTQTNLCSIKAKKRNLRASPRPFLCLYFLPSGREGRRCPTCTLIFRTWPERIRRQRKAELGCSGNRVFQCKSRLLERLISEKWWVKKGSGDECWSRVSAGASDRAMRDIGCVSVGF